MPPVYRDDPYGGYNFLVTINGVSNDGQAVRGSFAEVSGLEAEQPAIEYRNGSEDITLRKLPGLKKYPNIVLKRGVTSDLAFWNWILKGMEGEVQRMPAEMSAMRGAQTLDPVVTLGREIEITATQAQHFSARTPFDRNRALWGGFMITIDEQQIYFAGDSGYGPHFLEVGRRFPRIDLALIPIGAYEPRWFMKDIHMNPEEAVQAHMDVGSRRSIGMHFGTFRLTTEGPNEPVAALGRARSAAGIDDAAFTTLDVGESARL